MRPMAARRLLPILFAVAALTVSCKGGSPASPRATEAGVTRDATRPGTDADTEAGADATVGPTFPGLVVFATQPNTSSVTSFFEFLPEANATVTTSTDPVAAANGASGDAGHGGGDAGTLPRVAVVTDLSCGECYQLAGTASVYEVHGGNALGAQYGLAQLLEELGFRFFHPWQSKAPTSFVAPVSSPNIGPMFTPAMTLRGLHLHTLHPIESYFTFWATQPSAGATTPDAGAPAYALTGVDGARRVIDWIVKNRGNYVEWSALNDIVTANATDVATWRAHTSTLITYAHARGIKVGIGTELFGVSNLQNSFDLLDNESDPNAQADVDARLHLLTDGLPWDIVDLSFGEFSGTDPNVFLTSVNLAYTELGTIAPQAQMSATIHLGNYPSLQVTYDGMTLLYYYLIKYANPNIVPWIHTVMYFDLFQPVDGAYNLQNFDQHLAYLQQRLSAGQPVAYYPESAYWVSFDDSVPTYLPVYMRSRWLDQSNLASAAVDGGYPPLQQHVMFSSGWEWGYWQNDYATLRANFTLPAAWTDSVDEMFAPWGAQGAALAAQIGALGELQSQYLIDDALAAYIAGADVLIELAVESNMPSQPARTSFSAVAAMSPADLATFTTTVLTPLAALDAATASIASNVAGMNLDPKDPWLAETADGIAIDADRTHYIYCLYEAVATFTSTGSDGGWLAKATTTMADAQTIVNRRDGALHYPNPPQILNQIANSTLYQGGFLEEAATLCYWNRELIEAEAVISNNQTNPPGCVP